MITITDGQTDLIVDDIHEDFFWDDRHYQSMKDTLETFDFTTFADKPFSEHLTKNNRIIIPGEDGELLEFIIQNTRKYRSQQGRLLIDVFTSASYIELCKAKVIEPQRLQGATAKSAAQFAVQDTEWQVGEVDYTGIRSINIESHTNPYKLLKIIASTFDLELKFRVEHDGNKITKRYVELLERVGRWQGREIEFGKDLIGIERKEDTSNVVTALVGLGPEREDGTRLQVFVEDRDALQRWGRNGRHIIDVYEPQSTDVNMTENRLRELTQNELEKRVNSVVEYICEEADLEHVLGFEHEKVRFGDTIRIKDKGFTPPLYLEARVHTQERSIKKRGMKRIILGDYVEYTEEDIQAIWKSLQSQIANKMSLSDVLEVTYTKEEIDEKDKPGKEAKEKIDRDVGEAIIETTNGSQDKADQAEHNAKNHADNVANQARQEAITEAVNQAQQALSNAVNELEASIAEKADAEWVNGQLVLKENAITKSNTAPASPTTGQLWLDTSVTPNVLKRWDGSVWVKATPTSAGEVGAYTKTEVDNALNSKVSVTQYTADMNGVVARLDSAESRITQNENEIATKVSLTQYQQDQEDLSSQLSQMSTQIQQQADQIALKANKTDVYTKTQVDQELGKKVDTTVYNQKIGELTTSINGISANVSNLQTTVGQHGASISNLQSQVDIHAGQIATKVSRTEFENLQIGGRNYFVVKDALENTVLRWADGTEGPETGSLTSGFIPCAPLERFICNFVNQQTFYYNSNKEYIGATSGGIGVIPENTDNLSHKPSTMPDDNVPAYVRIVFRNNFLNGKTKEEIKIMLEKGNKPTDWTPAPEDVQSEIDNVYEYASSEIQQLAGEVSTKAEASTVTALGNRVTTAENNISALQGEITQKVSQSTFNALENRVTQAESTITQTANNVTVAFNRIDNIDGVLNSAVTTIDASGVTVKDGSFYLEDDTSDTKYSIVPKTNLLDDHSFEMVERTGSVDSTYGDFAVKPQIESFGRWRTVGSPRLLSAYQTDWIQFSLFYFGLQAIVVSNSNYVEQHFPYIPGKTYTVSAYFTGSTRSTSGVPRIDVRLEQAVTEEVKKTWTKSFSSVTFGQKLTRCSLTFTVPADADSSLGGDIVIVSIRADSGWVVADGVQVVEGETPTLYDPENSVWAILRGVTKYGFSSLDVNGEINSVYVNRIWGNANNEKYVSFYNSVDRTEDAFLGIVGNGDFVLRHKKGPLRLQSGTTRIFFNFNNSTGNTLTFEGGMIRNITGNGDLSLSSGDGAGVLMLRSPTREIRMLIGSDGLRVANLAYNGYRPVYASGFQNMSTRDLKKDIEPFDENGVEIINSASIKTYRYKEEDEDTKKHIGLIFDEAPPEITQQAGAIDLYAMCSVAWKAIQELSQKIKSLEEKTEGVKE